MNDFTKEEFKVLSRALCFLMSSRTDCLTEDNYVLGNKIQRKINAYNQENKMGKPSNFDDGVYNMNRGRD